MQQLLIKQFLAGGFGVLGFRGVPFVDLLAVLEVGVQGLGGPSDVRDVGCSIEGLD